MKKKLILTLAFLLGCAGFAQADVLANTKYFPDKHFLAWVLNHFNKIRGERLTDEELASVKSIKTPTDDWLKHYVKSLKGIEYFSELEDLYIYNEYDGYDDCKNLIEEVDLSKNKKLKTFYFRTSSLYYGDPDEEAANPYTLFYGYTTKAKPSRAASASTSGPVRLKSVNLANLPELRVVDIECHALPELDLRGCPNLQTVIVHDSENAVDIKLDSCSNLEIFAYSKCSAGVELPDFALMPNLRALMCDDGKITKLDLSGVANKLEVLSCSGNLITNLDLSKCTKLKSLRCESLPVTTLDCSQLDSLKSIDVANCSSLQSFPTLPSGITTIMCDNVKAFANVDLGQYPNLTNLRAEKCGITKFDASMCPNLLTLSLDNNNIAGPNLSGFNYVVGSRSPYNYYYASEQEIYINAISVPELKNYWRLLLPDDVNLSQMLSYKFIVSDWSEQYKLYIEYYEDEQGNLKPSFVTNWPVNTNYKRCIYYQYDTGGTYKIKSNGFANKIETNVEVYVKVGFSGVDDVAADKVVKGVKYFDLQGHESAEPFSGFNIKVTQYTDGTTSSTKVVK